MLRAEQGRNAIQYVHQVFAEQEIVDGVPAYLHRDALGSTRLVTDSAGQPQAQLAYSAFGETDTRRPARRECSNSPASSSTARLDSTICGPAITIRRQGDLSAAIRHKATLPRRTDSPAIVSHNNPVNFSDPSGRMTLAETLVVVRERLQQYKTDILRYKKSLDTVTTRIGEVAQYVGGAMAAVAVSIHPTTSAGPSIRLGLSSSRG